MKEKVFLISGFSGVGKTTIVYELIEKNPKIEKVITSTSRSIRPGEESGKDYYFYTKEEMEEMRNKDEFYETADVYGNLYGSEKKEVRRIFDSGHVPLFVCDTQGVENLSKVVDNLITIFVVPDSLENLRKRIEGRDGSTPEDVERRLREVDEESKVADICDYRVVNIQGKLSQAVSDVQIIIEKELNN